MLIYVYNMVCIITFYTIEPYEYIFKIHNVRTASH